MYTALDKNERERLMPALQYGNIEGYCVLYKMFEKEERIDSLVV